MRKKSELSQKADKLILKVKNQNFIWLYFATICIWGLLFAVKVILGGMDIQNLISSVLDNMLGIIPPMLIFDFIYEKLTRDASAMELSEKITETLMSDPETLTMFTEEQRKVFINSTISSIITDEKASQMVQECIRPYLVMKPHYKIRPQFRYTIHLQCDSIPTNPVFANEDYFYVEEVLSYRIHYLDEDVERCLPNEFCVSYLAETEKLDNALREKNVEEGYEACIFRESLNIRKDDLEQLKKMPEPELMDIFTKVFKLKIRIDDKYAEITKLCADDRGILIKMRSDHDSMKKTHSVQIYFHMPQIWNTEMVVALSDPTYSPEIMVSYQENIMDVDMYSFLSESEESSVEKSIETDNGIYNMVVVDKWIYPMSGMVFTIKKRS